MTDIIIYPNSPESFRKGGLTNEKRCFGVDLGTTSTLVCYVDSEHVDLEKDMSLPVQFVMVRQDSPFPYNPSIEDEKVASILGVHNNTLYVGSNLHHLKAHPEFEYKKNLFYHWKLELGIDHHPMYPDAINEKLDMPYKIAGGILNNIRRSRFGDSPLANAIITVPASFQANQRKDVLRAAELAKIETSENMLIDEPNAAFLGYFNRLETEKKIEWSKSVKNKNVLVVDFGGGTLDLSILNVDFRRDTGITISNKAISRYNDLGGQDVDMIIAEEFLIPKLKELMPDFDLLSSLDLREVIMPQLALIGEGLKIGVSQSASLRTADRDISSIDISDIFYKHPNCLVKYKDKEYDLGTIEIQAQEFKDLFSKLFTGKYYSFKYVDKTVASISMSITDIITKANLTLDAIDFVLFVGGSSFNPFLHSLCKQKLVNSESLTTHEPDKLVAEGAAVYSYFLNARGVSLISPITSETIGITLAGDRFHPILESGQTLPRKVVIPDFKLQNNLKQREVLVPVCINGNDYPIGEIRSTLDKFYGPDTVVKIDAEITIDKVFKMEVYVDNDLIGEAEFENPYSIGKLTEEELDVYKHKVRINKAKQKQDLREEKTALRELIWKYYDIDNNQGVIESAEEYLRRFDDLDESVWNMLYIGNNRLGRIEAAKEALKKALDINPRAPYLHYNYSLLLGKHDQRQALEYLEGLDDNLKYQSTRLRIILLKYDLGEDMSVEANQKVSEYMTTPSNFSDYDKDILLSDVFRIVNKPYSYTSPKEHRNQLDEGSLLDSNNLPL